MSVCQQIASLKVIRLQLVSGPNRGLYIKIDDVSLLPHKVKPKYPVYGRCHLVLLEPESADKRAQLLCLEGNPRFKEIKRELTQILVRFVKPCLRDSFNPKHNLFLFFVHSFESCA